MCRLHVVVEAQKGFHIEGGPSVWGGYGGQPKNNNGVKQNGKGGGN